MSGSDDGVAGVASFASLPYGMTAWAGTKVMTPLMKSHAKSQMYWRHVSDATAEELKVIKPLRYFFYRVYLWKTRLVVVVA